MAFKARKVEFVIHVDVNDASGELENELTSQPQVLYPAQFGQLTQKVKDFLKQAEESSPPAEAPKPNRAARRTRRTP